jgi:hypothetical protein
MVHVVNWRLDHMLSHPRLFEVMSDEPHLSFGYPLCEEGWREILETLCTRIESALQEDESFQFVRIKQKFGILRVDCDYEGPQGTEAKVDHAVDLAVARSACTCEICGAEGRLYSNRGWLGTRCAEHAAGDPVPPRYGHGFENVRRLRRWHGQADVYYAHYDRGTDTLTEVPRPTTRHDKNNED